MVLPLRKFWIEKEGGSTHLGKTYMVYVASRVERGWYTVYIMNDGTWGENRGENRGPLGIITVYRENIFYF